MAFTPVDIPIVLELETDFVTDFRETTNSNLSLISSKVEDLINLLEIDINNQQIGTDNPITSLKARSIILQNTGLIFQNNDGTTLADLTLNTDGDSVFTVNILEVDETLTADEITANTLTISSGLTVAGTTTHNAPVVHNSGVSESKETTNVTLTADAGVAKGTITLTSTSRENIFVTLRADTSVYVGGGLVGAINKVELVVDFDSANPPSQNQKFNIHIVDIVEDGTGTSIIGAVNTKGGSGLDLEISAGTNNSSGDSILLHSDFDSIGKELIIPAGEIISYNSNVSLLYILDADSNDRLMIKGLVEFIIS